MFCFADSRDKMAATATLICGQAYERPILDYSTTEHPLARSTRKAVEWIPVAILVVRLVTEPDGH